MKLSKILAQANRKRSFGARFDLLCGELLNYGIHRDVYALKDNNYYVVKVERDFSEGNFSNVCEWRNWINNKDWKKLGKWLAPCEAILDSGQILIQRRVHQCNNRQPPLAVPWLFTDLKLQNWGWIGDQFVCCDYPFLLFHSQQIRLKRARWRNVPVYQLC